MPTSEAPFPEVRSGEARPLSALPSRRARGWAFASILLAGICGGLIGSSFVRLQCEQDCTTRAGIGGIVGALVGAAGVAVVAVLVLRAMGEWQHIAEAQAAAGDDAADDGEDDAMPRPPG